MPLEIPNLSKIKANLIQEHVKMNTIENHQITLNMVEYNTQFFIYCIKKPVVHSCIYCHVLDALKHSAC